MNELEFTVVVVTMRIIHSNKLLILVVRKQCVHKKMRQTEIFQRIKNNDKEGNLKVINTKICLEFCAQDKGKPYSTHRMDFEG